jgi:3-oxoacyl-(acyl-carrier-protein) synthase
MRSVAWPEPPVVLRAVGALSAAGAGPAALLAAALAAAPLGRPVRRYDVARLRTRTAALLPEDLLASVCARWSGLDPAVALSLEVIDQALGGEPPPREALLVVGTSLGCTTSWEPWHRALVGGEAPPVAPRGAGHGDVAWQVAERLGLCGPALTVSTACTSSTQALLLAADRIAQGEVEEALVVGVDVLGTFVHGGFDALKALAPDGRPPTPFGPERAGLWLGEGAACAWLRRQGPGLAALLGGACAGDGHHITAPEPSGRGLAQAIRGALGRSGCEAVQIGWISAHGTGTLANDAMEASAFRQVFGERIPPVHALKPVIGHTLGASGLLEVVFLCEAMRAGVRPPSFSVAVDPALAPLLLDATVAPLPEGPVLTVNSAFAGHNTALVLADLPRVTGRSWRRSRCTSR